MITMTRDMEYRTIFGARKWTKAPGLLCVVHIHRLRLLKLGLLGCGATIVG